MKYTSAYIGLALAAALAMGLMAGCSSQQAPSGQEAGSAAASAVTGQAQDEIISELKDAIANIPAYESVTITEETATSFPDDAEAEGTAAPSDDLTSTTVYRFDASGDALKTSLTAEIGDIKLEYFSDGDEAVCVTDGPVYSGTTEQFDLESFKGADAYLESTIGDLDTLVDCAATVEKTQTGATVAYRLTLDPDKYIASDEILTTMAESGDPVLGAAITIEFGEDGSIASIDKVVEYEKLVASWSLAFSDYDSTVIAAMPEADKTFEEMDADIQDKMDALDRELELDGAEEGQAE